MKRISVFSIAMALLLCLSACGSGTSVEASTESAQTATEQAESVEAASAEEPAAPASDVQAEADEADASEPLDMEESAPADSAVTISEQVIYESDGIKITATGISMDEFIGPELKLLIENDSDTDIGVGSDYACVNGYMIYGLFSSDVPAGKKSNESYSFMLSDLEAAGISEIATITFELHLFDPESYMTTTEIGDITINTSIADTYQQEYDSSGEVLIDENGLKVVAKGIDEDDYFGPFVKLYYENNTDSMIIVQSEDVSVNGFMIFASSSVTLLPGSHAIDGITIFQSDLDENGIETIEDVEFSLHTVAPDTYETLYTSAPVTVTN